MEEKKGHPYNIPSFEVLLIYHGVEVDMWQAVCERPSG